MSFYLQNKFMVYGLTNSRFDGRKRGSQLAIFGKSKEIHCDANTVALATVVIAEGFTTYSRMYQGNICDKPFTEPWTNYRFALQPPEECRGASRMQVLWQKISNMPDARDVIAFAKAVLSL